MCCVVGIAGQGVTTADFPDGQLGGKAVQLHGQALRSEEGKPTTALLYDQSMAFVDYTQVGVHCMATHDHTVVRHLPVRCQLTWVVDAVGFAAAVVHQLDSPPP